MKNTHRPNHNFDQEGIYFLTGRTYGKLPHLAGDKAKKILKDSLFEKTKKFGLTLYAWTIMDNHYHILVEESVDGRGLKPASPSQRAVNRATPPFNGVADFSPRQEEERGVNSATPNSRAVNRASSETKKLNRASSKIPNFIRELHGASSFKIKKIPARQILNEEQIAHRERTPMEERIEKRLNKIINDWERALKRASPSQRGLKPATLPFNEVADFSPRQEEERVINCASPNPNSRAVNRATPPFNEVADFSPRLTPNQRKKIEKTITLGDLRLAKTLLTFYLPEYFDIPFWYQYTDHTIRSDKDFYCHLNYIHQNCVKHGLSKRVSEYKFSSYNDWLKKKGKIWMREVLEKYPVIDFGGEWLE